MDIYFEEKYGRLYEEIEDGKLEVFEYSGKLGSIRNMFIKREIPTKIDNIKYYDLITPYGYGGPIIVTCNDELKKDELVKGYYDKFKEYCLKNKIVSEFIRFHPINKNYEDFTNIFETKYLRKTVVTNLKEHENPFQEEFKKRARTEIRKALREGVTYNIYHSPKNLTKFKELYYSTMNRRGADEYYYFTEQYFDNMLNYLNKNILVIELVYKSQVIASELYFIKNKMMYVHLLGYDENYMHLNANGVLEYAASIWGKKNSFDYIHHGGGITNNEDDSLLIAKRKFGQNEDRKFYIGKKIWNLDIYEKLCAIEAVNETIDFFPAYRFKKE